MAKIRRRYRNYRKSTRWSANLRDIFSTQISAPSSASFQSNTTLCSNPPQQANMITTVYTVKNVEFNGNITIIGTDSSVNRIEDIIAYIMYVPQGMVVGPDYDTLHPEYILAMKYYGKPQYNTPGITNPNPIRVKTRLSRKLQSGDSIILYIKGYNLSSSSYTLQYSGVTRWWTKSN